MSNEGLKIVFLSGLYPPVSKGGGEISTYLIAEGLRARGHEVSVITEQNSHLGLLKKPLFERRHSRRIASALPRVLAFPAPPSGAHETLRARRGAPGAPPATDGNTIYHAHDFRSALALSELQIPPGGIFVVTARDYAQVCGTTNNALIYGSRCLCTLHDIRRTQRYREVSWPRRLARAWQYWHNVPYRVRAFERFQHEIFISHAQKQEIETHPVRAKFGMSKKLPPHTAVIYNPVSTEYLSTPIDERRAGHVLYVGRLEDYKGVRLLIEAWKYVAKTVAHAHLTLIGEGAQKQDYEAYVAREGLQYRVTFKGRVPYERLRGEYDNAKIVVAPHVWLEPFGRTVAEAMARGKIVVVADAGGPAEIIQDNVTGMLFQRGSMDALTHKLREALALPELQYREISSRARAWTKAHLSLETIAQQYESFYDGINS